MKNLKKVLSLALAFAMVLGLCVTGMAAQDVTTLTDWDEVSDKDAVMLLNAFDIMQGHANGTFNAEGNVTRAQAAKMLAMALWGGDDKSELFKDGNVGNYTDVVATEWYMGYVNYVSATGLMTGTSSETPTFRPNSTVTGYQLLKMCLVALGYEPGAEGENLEGTGWDIRTMVLATAKLRQNLTEGTTVTNWSAPLSRMNAAIIIKNMINRAMVEYNDDGTVKVLDTTFGEALLGMVITDGTLVANEFGTTKDADYAGKLEEEGKNALVLVNVYDKDGKPTGTELRGVSIASELTDLGTSVQVYLSDETVVYAAVTGTAVTPAADKSNLVASPTPVTVGTAADTSSVTYTDSNVKADTDDKGDVEVTVNYKLAKVTSVIETETFGTIYGLDGAKWVAKSDDKGDTLKANFLQASASAFEAAEGDYIAYNTVKTATSATYNNGYVLEAVEGKINRVKYDTDGKTVTDVTINGVTYKPGKLTLAFGNEGIFHVYADGTVAAYEKTGGTTAADKTYAVVFDVQVTSITGALTTTGAASGMIVDVAAVLENGVSGVYEVATIVDGTSSYTIGNQTVQTVTDKLTTDKKVVGDSIKDLIGENGKVTASIFEYTLNDDGTMNLTTVATKGSYGTTVTADGTAKLTGGSSDYLTNDTVIFVKNKDTGVWSTVTGISGKATFTATETLTTSGYLGNAGTSSLDYALAGDTYAVVGATPVKGLFYIISNNGQVGVDGSDEIYEVVLFNGTTVETVETKQAVNAGEMYDDETLTNKYSTTTKGYINAVEGNILALGTSDKDGIVTTSNLYTLTSETKYYLISGEDSAALTVEDIDVQDAPGFDNKTYKSAYQAEVVDDGKGNATVVIIHGESINVK